MGGVCAPSGGRSRGDALHRSDDLHHAAFDRHILGIRPDFVVEVQMDILNEKDGPMLQHGLQGFQGKTILRPTSRVLWPRPDFLAERYEEFRRAS